MSCGVGHRRYSDLALLWLWHSPAATALIRRLGTWEPPYAAGMALKRPKKKKIKGGIANTALFHKIYY